MTVYYLITAAAVIMFSLQFWFNDRFQTHCGSSAKAAMLFSLGTNLAGFAALLIINRFRFEFTPFSLGMAFLVGLDGILFLYCSLKAFAVINLSLYSVFSMLGGMTLPFILGIAVYGEALTAGKLLCFAFTAAALALTVKKGGGGKRAYLYYAGIFVLNGMSGVLAKLFQEAPYPKTSAAGFSVLSAAAGAVLAAALLPFMKGKLPKRSLRPALDMAAYGAVNRAANFLLLISLAHLPASAQYPFVTGGVMIVSTLICFLTPQKPGKKELAAVGLSFIGILFLVLL